MPRTAYPEHSKKKIVQFAISEGQYSILIRIADVLGMSPNDYAKNLVINAIVNAKEKESKKNEPKS